MRVSDDMHTEGHSISDFKKALEEEGLTSRATYLFRDIIYRHYNAYARTFPWRNTCNPYHILISEIMLQQTQTERVTKKYDEFIAVYPDFYTLAKAPLRDILTIWQGLGYNRRAIALKNIAEIVVTKHGGILPHNVETLVKLPGIGKYTASAICAFAFNQPTVFIETNIRAVFIHFFFHSHDGVKDSSLLPLVIKTLDATNPREWYYALMDYGAMVKQKYANPTRRSTHYRKQTPFKGSNRQIRGMILKTLTIRTSISEDDLIKELNISSRRVKPIIKKLQEEGFIKTNRDRLMIA